MSGADATGLAGTRTTLHAVAEMLMAGPQLAASDTVRLAVSQEGFRTTREPDLRCEGGFMVRGDVRAAIHGATLRSLAATLGVEARAPVTAYAPQTQVGLDDVLTLDADAVSTLTSWYATGAAALAAFAPQQTAVLWPEHFDVGITWDEINYGASPGDSFSDAPYAYVGPWTPRTGEFWNAPFGAYRTLDELPSADDLVAFFTTGRTHSH